MKFAADFRRIAREALKGKWIISILVNFVAVLVGAGILSGGGGGYTGSSSNSEGSSFLSIQILATLAVMGIIVALVITFAIGGPCKLGYAKYNLALIDRKDAKFGDLFSQFGRFSDGFIFALLYFMYLFLWSLLFVIPVIIKSYSYAMAPYILYEHPELSPNDAITESRRIMHGNKWRLFCLNFSFIGWILLASLPTLIALGFTAILAMTGSLGLTLLSLPITFAASLCTIVASYAIGAYTEAAGAAFYREITQTSEEYIITEA